MSRRLRLRLPALGPLALALSVAFSVVAAVAAPAVARAETVLKIATLAPEGSAWMKLFHEWATNVEKRAPGKIRIKFYAGGVQGDERDAVRKMNLGTINGAAVTAIGLGLIQPEVRVLDMPFLFHSYAELDFVRDQLAEEFRKKFEEKGYVLLAWGDVGPVHLFSNVPLRTRADMLSTKMWAWTDDPVVQTLFQVVGLTGVPLGVPDVLPALQTGRINAVYGSPLAAVALQWQSKIKFATSMIVSQSVGATVVTRKAWEGMPPEVQAIVMEEAKKLSARTVEYVRRDNVASLDKMKADGVLVVTTPPELQADFERASGEVAKRLEGKLFSKEFYERVVGLAKQKRGAGK